MPVLESLSKEAVAQRCFVKRVFLKISQNSQENSCARVSFPIKLQASGLQLYLKRDSGIGVSFEFCKISKNTFSYRTSLVTASVSNTVKYVQAVRVVTLLKRDPSTGVLEAAICRSSTKWVFLNNSQNSRENTYVRVSF